MPDKNGEADVSDFFKASQLVKMGKQISAQAEAENNFQKNVINDVVAKEREKKAQKESEQMPRLSILGPHGYHVEFDPQNGPSKAVENDTYTCAHFGGHIVIQRKDTPQAWCKRCGGMVCEYHAQFGACNPENNPNREEWLEKVERNQQFLRDLEAAGRRG